MTNRRAEGPGDSLELLLDTISNAFGGILFVAILLALLLRISGPKSDAQVVSEPARSELVELSGQLDAVVAELESLEEALALQTQTRSRLTTPDLEQRYQELLKLREARQALDKGIRDVTHAIARKQQEIDAIATQSEQLDRELEATRDAADIARSELEKERKRRTQTIVPPQTRSTTKLECPVVVRYGRFYLKYRSHHSSYGREINLVDFVVIGEQGGRLRLTPKPLGGTTIDDGESARDVILGKLEDYKPERWYVCLVIWEDSFDRFLSLKKRLIDAGYELRIMPMQKGDSVSEGHVSDPQVQ